MTSVKDLENKLAKFIYDLETEDRLVRVGLKDKLETAKIYQKYKELFTQKTLSEIEKLLAKSKNKKTQDILQRIYFTIAGSFIGLATAKLHDEITTSYSQATVTLDNENLAFFELAPRISKERIFEKRERYDDAANKIKSKQNPKQFKLLKEEIKLFKKLGFAGYLDYYSQSKKVDYASFHKVVQKTIKDTDNLWDWAISKASQEILGRSFKNIRACHLLYLRSLSPFDNFYPANKVTFAFLELVNNLGLNDLLSKITIDSENRPKKNPRAVCYWPDPPREVHLVIRPIGGEQDYEAMFHEGGHALHGASIDSQLPFPLKTLSRSGALTETYAFILESPAYDPEWLSYSLNVSTHSAQRIKWQATFVDLMMLRRYLGKFSYEYEMFLPAGKAGAQNAISRGPQLYSRNLQRTTGFITNRLNWLSDMDSGFYSADYLRAWIAAAQIKDYLNHKFGQRWFLNKKAGRFWRELWQSGVTYEVEDVVKKLGYKPWDISLLINEYKHALT